MPTHRQSSYVQHRTRNLACYVARLPILLTGICQMPANSNKWLLAGLVTYLRRLPITVFQ